MLDESEHACKKGRGLHQWSGAVSSWVEGSMCQAWFSDERCVWGARRVGRGWRGLGLCQWRCELVLGADGPLCLTWLCVTRLALDSQVYVPCRWAPVRETWFGGWRGRGWAPGATGQWGSLCFVGAWGQMRSDEMALGLGAWGCPYEAQPCDGALTLH